MANAISMIKKNYNVAVNIEELAQAVGMSSSTFHKYFKDLMNENGGRCECGIRVGYEIPSQFSREYSRLFGKSPKQEMKVLKSIKSILKF